MALVKSLSGNHSRGFGLGSVCSLGRKRVLVRSQSSISPSSNNISSASAADYDFGFDFEFDSDFGFDSPVKRQCVEDEGKSESNFVRTEQGEEKSLLEAMPQDILIKIICGVNHDDLKQLVQVSKLICEATVIAKKWHFAYSTPSKIKAFRNYIDLDANQLVDDDYEAPNAPKQSKIPRSRLHRKKLGDISVRLFDSEDEDDVAVRHSPKYRKSLFMDI